MSFNKDDLNYIFQIVEEIDSSLWHILVLIDQYRKKYFLEEENCSIKNSYLDDMTPKFFEVENEGDDDCENRIDNSRNFIEPSWRGYREWLLF